jgi:hypothetical protein
MADKPLTPEETEALAQYGMLRAKGMNHHAAIAAINLFRTLRDETELDDKFVARLKRLAP